MWELSILRGQPRPPSCGSDRGGRLPRWNTTPGSLEAQKVRAHGGGCGGPVIRGGLGGLPGSLGRPQGWVRGRCSGAARVSWAAWRGLTVCRRVKGVHRRPSRYRTETRRGTRFGGEMASGPGRCWCQLSGWSGSLGPPRFPFGQLIDYF